MKRIFLFLPALFVIQLAFSQTNVPNGDFENWIQVSNPPNNIPYYQPDPVGGFWSTLNELVDISPYLGGPGPLTVERTDDAYSGTYAAKMISGFFGPPVNVFIPGMLGSTKLDIQHYTIHLGKPCPPWRPQRFKGFYKFMPVNGDSCAAVCMVTKFNITNHKRDTLGYGKQVFKDAVTAYTPFDFPIIYTNTVDLPDSITILMVSSAGFSVTNLMGGVGQVGSTMWADEVSIENPSGIDMALMPEKNISLFPNPANDKVTVQLDTYDKELQFVIYSSDGVRMSESVLRNSSASLLTSGLPNGNYFFQLMDGKHLINSGNFIIQH